MQVVATYHGDHAYCFDVSGAGQTASSGPQQPGGPPLNLFAHPAASAALAAGALSHGLTTGGLLRNGGSLVAGASSSTNGYSGSGSSGGSMGDLPGMLPAAAERAKADGNLALFSKQARVIKRACLLCSAQGSKCACCHGVGPAALRPNSDQPSPLHSPAPLRLPCQCAAVRSGAALQHSHQAGALGALALHQPRAGTTAGVQAARRHDCQGMEQQSGVQEGQPMACMAQGCAGSMSMRASSLEEGAPHNFNALLALRCCSAGGAAMRCAR